MVSMAPAFIHFEEQLLQLLQGPAIHLQFNGYEACSGCFKADR